MSDRVVARIIVERRLQDDGRDVVWVGTDDMDGHRLAVVEALGLLGLAAWDVLNYEDES